MSKKKNTDDRRRLLIRYQINEKGEVGFIDPCCDGIPATLFLNIMKALSEIQEEWNSKLKVKDIDMSKNQ